MSSDILNRLQQTTQESERTWIITETLLNKQPEPLKNAIFTAAVPHWFNARILSALSGLEAADAEAVYSDLRKFSFTESFGTLGHMLHDLTRRAIIEHLRQRRSDWFQTISHRAYEHFSQLDGPQNSTESCYHLLVVNRACGINQFKRQMKNFLRERNFSAAENLLRNANELIDTEILGPKEAAVIEHQRYLIGRRYAEYGKKEPSPDKKRIYFLEALKRFNPWEDITHYQLFESTILHQTVNDLQRKFLVKKLAEAKELKDISRQKIWLIEMGDIHLENKASLRDLDHAIMLDEEDDRAFALRAETHRRMGNFEEALMDLNRAIELDEKDDWNRYSQGIIYLLMDMRTEALQSFERAIDSASQTYDAEPDNWRNNFNLALYKIISEKTEDGEKIYRNALNIGVSEYSINEATMDLADFLELFPDHKPARAMCGLLQRHLEERSEDTKSDP